MTAEPKEAGTTEQSNRWSVVGVLTVVLRFAAGALIVGLPLAVVVAVHWIVSVAVAVICGLLAARYGDAFFDSVADSDWWQVVRGFFRLGGR